MAWMADEGPAMLVVPVSMATIVPLPTDMAVPWTVNAVGCPSHSVSCRRSCSQQGRGRLTVESKVPVARGTRDIDVVDRTRVQATVRVSCDTRSDVRLQNSNSHMTHPT